MAKYLVESFGEKILSYYNVGKENDSNESAASLSDIAYTLQIGREGMEERLAVIAQNKEELKTKLEQYISGTNNIDNLYCGNIKAGKAVSNLITSGKTGKEFLKLIIQENNISKLAQLWVSGVEIDWSLLYTGKHPRRVSLPTYPFEKKRYWVEDGHDTQYGRMTGKLHPLLDRLDAHLSHMEQGIVFTKAMHSEEKILGEHRVKGEAVLPGVGYLEMVYAGAQQIRGGEKFRLGRVNWLRPLGVNGEARDVRLVIKGEGEELRYAIKSGNNGQETTHSIGEIYFNGSNKEEEQRVSIEDIRSRCTREIDKESLYRACEEIGISYGPYFQGVNRIWSNNEEALGYLSAGLL